MTKKQKIVFASLMAIAVAVLLVFLFTRKKGEQKVAVNKSTSKTPAEIEAAAQAVIRGEYKDYPEREALLIADGFDYQQVQARVNEILSTKV